MTEKINIAEASEISNQDALEAYLEEIVPFDEVMKSELAPNELVEWLRNRIIEYYRQYIFPNVTDHPSVYARRVDFAYRNAKGQKQTPDNLFASIFRNGLNAKDPFPKGDVLVKLVKTDLEELKATKKPLFQLHSALTFEVTRNLRPRRGFEGDTGPYSIELQLVVQQVADYQGLFAMTLRVAPGGKKAAKQARDIAVEMQRSAGRRLLAHAMDNPVGGYRG